MAAGEEFARVGEAGQPFFRPRPGEDGISVFDPEAVDPHLTDDEILAAFRPGSSIVLRSKEAITSSGLMIVPVAGAELLPARLQLAHAEIRPVPGLTRRLFKDALRSLE